MVNACMVCMHAFLTHTTWFAVHAYNGVCWTPQASQALLSCWVSVFSFAAAGAICRVQVLRCRERNHIKASQQLVAPLGENARRMQLLEEKRLLKDDLWLGACSVDAALIVRAVEAFIGLGDVLGHSGSWYALWQTNARDAGQTF